MFRPRIWKRWIVLVGMMGLFSSASGHPGAASVSVVKLSEGSTNVVTSAISTNDMVVYMADSHLYSVPITGNQLPLRLVPQGTEIRSFKINPDGQSVVYVGLHPNDSALRLYTVPVSGGSPVLLSTSMKPDHFMLDFLVSPDGSRVVYRTVASLGIKPPYALYSVASTAGPAVELPSLIPTADASKDQYAISPDGQTVVYQRTDSDGSQRLYSSPIAGGTSTELVPSSHRFLITEDSSRVIVINLGAPLVSVPITGGLATVMASGANITWIELASSDIVYVSDDHLYRLPIAGGDRVQLDDQSGSDPAVLNFEIAPDESRVVYLFQSSPFTHTALLSTPLAGGASTQLNGSLDPTGYGLDPTFLISPDSTRVVYGADQDRGETIPELYSVPIDGAASSVKLNRPLEAMPWMSMGDTRISPNSQFVLYRISTDSFGHYDLYRVPIAGGESVKVNGAVPHVVGLPSQNPSILVAPNSKSVVFLGTQTYNDPEHQQLYASRIVDFTHSIYIPLNVK